ncbi:UNVERIFIED_CONTAM: hypothetical protein K2H54_042670 [Gekko kuhli]
MFSKHGSLTLKLVSAVAKNCALAAEPVTAEHFKLIDILKENGNKQRYMYYLDNNLYSSYNTAKYMTERAKRDAKGTGDELFHLLKDNH